MHEIKPFDAVRVHQDDIVAVNWKFRLSGKQGYSEPEFSVACKVVQKAF